jgi:AcrR family transcriptional regulator
MSRSGPGPPRPRALTIADLVAETDVPPATVHYYLRHGLLPQPKRVAANRFTYDRRHVQALKLIRTLRERRGLSLDMIRRIMPELLRLEAEDAFSPVMWDKALGPRMSRRRTPSARLLDAAKDAFAKRGYADVNVDDICHAARIAKGSFYRHYRSKEELFFAAAAALASDVTARFVEVAGPQPVGVEEAGAVLARLIDPALPVFLDLFARALQRRPGYPASAESIFGQAVLEIGRLIAGDGSASELGSRAVGRAIADVFRSSLGSADLTSRPVVLVALPRGATP